MPVPSKSKVRPQKLDHAVEKMAELADLAERWSAHGALGKLNEEGKRICDWYYGFVREYRARPTLRRAADALGCDQSLVRRVLTSEAAAYYLMRRSFQDLVSLAPLAVASIQENLTQPKAAMEFLKLLRDLGVRLESRNQGGLPEVE